MEPLPVASRASSLVPTPRHTPGGFTYQTPTGQEPGLPTPGQPSTIRPPIALEIGAGILTSFPSAMAFALTLGADSPYADERCVGNLALTASGLFTRFNATKGHKVFRYKCSLEAINNLKLKLQVTILGESREMLAYATEANAPLIVMNRDDIPVDDFSAVDSAAGLVQRNGHWDLKE